MSKIEEGQGESVLEVLRTLGALWGLGRPLKYAELGRAIRLGPSDPSTTVSSWVQEEHGVPGPASACMEMMMLGTLPPDGLSAVILRPLKGRKRPDRAGRKVGEADHAD